MIRVYIGLVVLAGLLVVTAVLGGRGGLFSITAPLPPEAQAVNRIAYVSRDARIITVNPDGTDVQPASQGDGFFTWPTWSPDGQSLVYSGVINGSSPNREINLYSFNIPSGQTSQVYTGEPGIVGLLAEGVVHYPLWSPNSQHLAFIAVTALGLTLLMDDTSDSVDAQPVLGDGPLWMSWSPDSQKLLVHRGINHFLVSPLDGNEVTDLGMHSGGYRVPAWEPSGSSITLASEEDQGGVTLYSGELSGNQLGQQEPITEVSPIPMFLWSPDGSFLAVSSSSRVLLYQGMSLFVSRQLVLIPKEGVSPEIEIQENVVAYFWSPDSAKLAYAVLSETPGVLRWMLLDVETRSSRPLADFVPSREQLTMFQFFDQYAYSHFLWSPDSKSLVFAGTIWAGTITASLASGRSAQPQSSDIIVLEASRDPNPTAIAEGILAFWSPL